MEPAVFTIQQFVEVYKISRTSLYFAWKQGRGPKRIKIGRRTLIPVRAADEWLQGLLDSEGSGQ